MLTEAELMELSNLNDLIDVGMATDEDIRRRVDLIKKSQRIF